MVGGDGRASIERWLRVTDHVKWVDASPFDLVDGGKEGFIRAILDVTSNVSDLPNEGAAFDSYLMARLVRLAHIPESSVAFVSVHVEMDKKGDHVERDEASKTSKEPAPAEAKGIFETTGMGWVEQVVLRGALAMGEVLSRQHVNELGFEGDVLDGAKFKHVVMSGKPWYMTFVKSNDAKGLFMWLKEGGERVGVLQVAQGIGVPEQADGRVVGAHYRAGLPAGLHRLLRRVHGAPAHAPRAVGRPA